MARPSERTYHRCAAEVRERHGIAVVSIATLEDVIAHLASDPARAADLEAHARLPGSVRGLLTANGHWMRRRTVPVRAATIVL